MILSFDIETIPNEDLLRNAPLAMPPPSVNDAPKNYKSDEAIAKWLSKASAGHQEKVLKRMSTDPVLGQVICIGALSYDPITNKRETTVFGCNPDNGDVAPQEASILEQFWTAASAADHYLTFNGHGFDIPFLEKRSQILGVDYTPIEHEAHTDLMRYTSTRSYGGGYNNFSLQELRKWFGLTQLTDHDGSYVYSDWLAGDTDSIHHHCIDDITAVLDIALRLNAL